MRLGPREVATPTLVLAGLAGVLVAAVVVGAITTGAAFAPHNPGWEGLSDLREVADSAGAETVYLTDSSRYETVDANGSVAVLLSPGPRPPEEQAALRSFVDRGGTLVVGTRSSETGEGLLADLGVDVRVQGPTLRDEHRNLHGPAFPLVEPTADHPAVRNAGGLSLNHGSALVVGADARTIANSSAFAYLDRDGDEAIGPGEELRPRPVVAAQSVGDGEVVVVSDPSVFINVMLDHEPNRRFAAALVADRERVLVDRTEEGIPPLRLALAWLRGWPLAPAALGGAAVAVVVGWERRIHRLIGGWIRARLPCRLRGRGTRGRTGAVGDADGSGARGGDGAGPASRGPAAADRRALSAYLADRYPEWDPERRERVLGGVMGDGPEAQENERID